MLVRRALEHCCNQILCSHTESGITWNCLQFMALFTAMEGECLNCVFKITQSRDNCRFYYKDFSKTLFASNTPILWGNKTAHLHFLAGATFTHLGLSLASLNMCIMIVTAVILSVAVGMPKWVNSYRKLRVCTIQGLLKQMILTLNVKNAREISSMTRQRYQRTVCSTITSLVYNCCVVQTSLNQCNSWISSGKLRPKFGLDSTSLVWTRGPLINSFHSTACSPLVIMQPQILHTPTRDLRLKFQALIHKEK